MGEFSLLIFPVSLMDVHSTFFLTAGFFLISLTSEAILVFFTAILILWSNGTINYDLDLLKLVGIGMPGWVSRLLVFGSPFFDAAEPLSRGALALVSSPFGLK